MRARRATDRRWSPLGQGGSIPSRPALCEHARGLPPPRQIPPWLEQSPGKTCVSGPLDLPGNLRGLREMLGGFRGIFGTLRKTASSLGEMLEGRRETQRVSGKSSGASCECARAPAKSSKATAERSRASAKLSRASEKRGDLPTPHRKRFERRWSLARLDEALRATDVARTAETRGTCSEAFMPRVAVGRGRSNRSTLRAEIEREPTASIESDLAARHASASRVPRRLAALVLLGANVRNARAEAFSARTSPQHEGAAAVGRAVEPLSVSR